jgi:hypothetical protein
MRTWVGVGWPNLQHVVGANKAGVRHALLVNRLWIQLQLACNADMLAAAVVAKFTCWCGINHHRSTALQQRRWMPIALLQTTCW